MLKEIPAAGHSIPVEAPDLFVAVLKEFLLHS
jgi:pimeloyl-ACP methyl ester carboxylesterase